MIQKRIDALQLEMKKRNIDIYIVPSADYHQSEYVGAYFKAREFMTGFTGSAGTAVFTQSEAYLWTDGRYFIQAEKELCGSGIHLQKMGEPGIPSTVEFLKSHFPEKGCLGFDGRSIGIEQGKQYEAIAEEKKGTVYYQEDLADLIWNDRPAMPSGKAFRIEESYAGVSAQEKIESLRAVMRDKSSDIHILTSLDDIGWLLNIRGNDVAYCPMLLSYLLLSHDQILLYADINKFDKDILEYLESLGVEILPYHQIYQDVTAISHDKTVLLDPVRFNYCLYQNLPKELSLIQEETPVILMKAVKNSVEISHIREAHRKDGVAFTKLMYWLKTNIGKMDLSEIAVSDQLEAFRDQQDGSMGPSFEPISAYKEHGAIVHYSASAESNKTLEARGLLLLDTGGHYQDGSTDITRTIALGPLTPEEKEDFTLVACGMLHLADAVFPEGCSGMALDFAARAPLWKKHKDFNHGTGHGVGFLGSIHEPPATINWKNRGGNLYPLKPGMVITDEPGIYIEGSHGIRTENELLVCEDHKNTFGRFLHFEILTLAPIDLDAIQPEIMSDVEKDLLNRYHKHVYERISPYLTEAEQKWLKIYTREI